MNFWDTVRGHDLADTLIRYLPKLANKKQYVISVSVNEFKATVSTELKKGRKYINHQIIDDEAVIIFEK